MNSRFGHVIFWSTYVLVRILAWGLYDMEFEKVAIQLLFELPIVIALTYAISYWVLPRLLGKFRWKPVLLGLLAFILALLGRRLLMQHLLYPWLYASEGFSFVFWDIYRLAGYFLEYLGIIGIFSAFKYFMDWQQVSQRATRLSAEKSEAQLKMLRAQVNPHFLFNTLNSIYSESLKKSDKAPELIIRLSDLLRFILKDCSEDLIPIEKEITLIEDFIALEGIRFGDQLNCSTSFQVQADTLVPPLLIFSLVENAFKHGISNNLDASLVRISITEGLGSLEVEVVNTLQAPVHAQPDNRSLGIGLENTLSQLDLLFGDAYDFITTSEEGLFKALLTIPVQKR